MIITGGSKKDSWVPDEDKILDVFVVEADTRKLNDVTFIRRLFSKLDNERYKSTVLLLMLGYKKKEIAEIHGINPSTIQRFDLKGIVKAVEVMKDNE